MPPAVRAEVTQYRGSRGPCFQCHADLVEPHMSAKTVLKYRDRYSVENNPIQSDLPSIAAFIDERLHSPGYASSP